MCGCVCMRASACGGQKRVSALPELEWKSPWQWVLTSRLVLWKSHWDISWASSSDPKESLSSFIPVENQKLLLASLEIKRSNVMTRFRVCYKKTFCFKAKAFILSVEFPVVTWCFCLEKIFKSDMFDFELQWLFWKGRDVWYKQLNWEFCFGFGANSFVFFQNRIILQLEASGLLPISFLKSDWDTET